MIATLWLWLEQSEGERAGKARRDWNILCGQQETEDPVKRQGSYNSVSAFHGSTGLHITGTQKGKEASMICGTFALTLSFTTR